MIFLLSAHLPTRAIGRRGLGEQLGVRVDWFGRTTTGVRLGPPPDRTFSTSSSVAPNVIDTTQHGHRCHTSSNSRTNYQSTGRGSPVAQRTRPSGHHRSGRCFHASAVLQRCRRSRGVVRPVGGTAMVDEFRSKLVLEICLASTAQSPPVTLRTTTWRPAAPVGLGAASRTPLTSGSS